MAFFHNLFNIDNSRQAHKHIFGEEPHHHLSWIHELVAGAVAFVAVKAYEDHDRPTGGEVSHPVMKEMLAGFAAAEVDKLFVSKELDFLDREKGKRWAIPQAHIMKKNSSRVIS